MRHFNDFTTVTVSCAKGLFCRLVGKCSRAYTPIPISSNSHNQFPPQMRLTDSCAAAPNSVAPGAGTRVFGSVLPREWGGVKSVQIKLMEFATGIEAWRMEGVQNVVLWFHIDMILCIWGSGSWSNCHCFKGFSFSCHLLCWIGRLQIVPRISTTFFDPAVERYRMRRPGWTIIVVEYSFVS